MSTGARRPSTPSREERATAPARPPSGDWTDAPVDRKGIVLERVELGQDAEPRRLGEGRQNGRQACQTAKRAKRVMPTIGEISRGDPAATTSRHRCYRAHTSRPMRLHHEKPTRCSGADGPVRLRASRTASRVAAIQSSHSTSVRAEAPCHAPAASANRQEPDHDRNAPCDADCTENPSDHQKHDSADRFSIRLEHQPAIKVCTKCAG